MKIEDPYVDHSYISLSISSHFIWDFYIPIKFLK